MLLAENETVPFQKGTRGYISVFAMGGPAHGVTLKGLSYTVENATIPDTEPIGVSNEFLPDMDSSITVEDGTLLIVITFA